MLGLFFLDWNAVRLGPGILADAGHLPGHLHSRFARADREAVVRDFANDFGEDPRIVVRGVFFLRKTDSALVARRIGPACPRHRPSIRRVGLTHIPIRGQAMDRSATAPTRSELLGPAGAAAASQFALPLAMGQ